METVSERVKKIIFDKLKLEFQENFLAAEDVRRNHHFWDDLGADSLDQIDILTAVEDYYDIYLGEPEQGFETVGELIEFTEGVVNG